MPKTAAHRIKVEETTVENMSPAVASETDKVKVGEEKPQETVEVKPMPEVKPDESVMPKPSTPQVTEIPVENVMVVEPSTPEPTITSEAAVTGTTPVVVETNETLAVGSEDKKAPSGLKGVLLAALAGFVVGGLLFGGLVYLKLNMDKLETPEEAKKEVTEASSVTPTTAPTAAPQASPAAEIKPAAYKVKVLNGSGVSGQAGVVKSLLETAGFTQVSTGNAASSTFSNTEVSTKKNTPTGVYTAIEKALTAKYTVIKTVDTLADSYDFDVVVTVGTVKK